MARPVITAREPKQNPVLVLVAVFSITLTQKRVCPPVWIILVLHAELASVRALKRECVLFIGSRFSNLYTSVDTPARGCVVLSKALITPTSHPLSNLCAMCLPCCCRCCRCRCFLSFLCGIHQSLSRKRCCTDDPPVSWQHPLLPAAPSDDRASAPAVPPSSRAVPSFGMTYSLHHVDAPLSILDKKNYEPRPGWAQDPLMVGIRSPDGLVVGRAPATLEFWVRFSNERNQGKQGATGATLC